MEPSSWPTWLVFSAQALCSPPPPSWATLPHLSCLPSQPGFHMWIPGNSLGALWTQLSLVPRPLTDRGQGLSLSLCKAVGGRESLL